MELTLPLLNKYLNLVLGYRTFIPCNDPDIIRSIQLTPNSVDYWHLEKTSIDSIPTTLIWRKKDWLDSEDRKRRALADKLIFDNALHLRREAFFNLCRAIVKELELGDYDDVMLHKHSKAFVFKMAEKFIKNKSETAQQFFGVDITSLPELPSQVTVLDERGKKEYEL